MAQKHFTSIEEILKEPGFLSDNPISLANYRALHGWYAFETGLDLACCVQRPSGTLCKTAHRKGWIARLQDDSLTIMGGTCATTKFGASSIVGQDISVAQNLRDAAQQLELLRSRVGDRDVMLRWCISARQQLTWHKERIEAFADGLGPAWSRLEAMSRTGNGAVQITGFTPAKRDPKTGEIVEDAVEIRILVGRLRNVEACNRQRTGELKLASHRLEECCRMSEEELLKMRGGRSRETLAIFADYPRQVHQLEALLALMVEFEKNDFTLLSYTVKELNDRAKVARFGRNRQGVPGGKEGARDWLMQNDAHLKEINRVERLRIG